MQGPPAGWVVRVTTKALQGPPHEEYWDTAIPDPVAAEQAVSNVEKATPGQEIRVVEALSESAVRGIGLRPGEVRKRQ